MRRGVQEFDAHRQATGIITDDDATLFLHGVDRRVISELHDNNVCFRIVTDNQACSLQYRLIRLVQYSVMIFRPSPLSMNGTLSNPPCHRLCAIRMFRSPGATCSAFVTTPSITARVMPFRRSHSRCRSAACAVQMILTNSDQAYHERPRTKSEVDRFPTVTPSPCPLPLRGGEGNKVDLADEAFDWNQTLCYRIYGEEETF